ncbi:MAG: hypothetical protein WCG32_04430 [Actinomycetes bacterium]
MAKQDNTLGAAGGNESSAEVTAEKTSLIKKFKNAPKRTKLIVAGVTGALLISGGAGAYAVYQAPDTVVAQAIVSLVTTQNPSYELDLTGTSSGLDGSIQLLTYSSDKGTALELNIKAKVVGQDAGATLNVVSDKGGDFYLNLANFSTLASILEQLGYLPSATIQSLSAALTDTWVKVSATDLTQATSALGNTGSCLSESASKQISEDVQGNLRSNFFVKVKEELAQEDGNRVFLLTLDAGKLKSFFKSFRTSKGFDELAKCQPGLSITDAMLESITQDVIDKAIASSGTTVKLYATAFDHKFVKLSVDVRSAGSTVNLSLKANGSHPEKVVIPSKSVTFSEFLTTFYSSVLGAGN